MLVLLSVLAVIVALALVARRILLPRIFSRILPVATKPHELKVLETMALDVRHRFVVLQWRESQYLILTSGGTPKVIDRKTRSEERTG
ncbi:MAG: hypothetical protein AAF442_00985 [Pseudomonadota bacterium]